MRLSYGNTRTLDAGPLPSIAPCARDIHSLVLHNSPATFTSTSTCWYCTIRTRHSLPGVVRYARGIHLPPDALGGIYERAAALQVESFLHPPFHFHTTQPPSRSDYAERKPERQAERPHKRSAPYANTTTKQCSSTRGSTASVASNSKAGYDGKQPPPTGRR